MLVRHAHNINNTNSHFNLLNTRPNKNCEPIEYPSENCGRFSQIEVTEMSKLIETAASKDSGFLLLVPLYFIFMCETSLWQVQGKHVDSVAHPPTQACFPLVTSVPIRDVRRGPRTRVTRPYLAATCAVGSRERRSVYPAFTAVPLRLL